MYVAWLESSHRAVAIYRCIRYIPPVSLAVRPEPSVDEVEGQRPTPLRLCRSRGGSVRQEDRHHWQEKVTSCVVPEAGGVLLTFFSRGAAAMQPPAAERVGTRQQFLSVSRIIPCLSSCDVARVLAGNIRVLPNTDGCVVLYTLSPRGRVRGGSIQHQD